MNMELTVAGKLLLGSEQNVLRIKCTSYLCLPANTGHSISLPFLCGSLTAAVNTVLR